MAICLANIKMRGGVIHRALIDGDGSSELVTVAEFPHAMVNRCTNHGGVRACAIAAAPPPACARLGPPPLGPAPLTPAATRLPTTPHGSGHWFLPAH